MMVLPVHLRYSFVSLEGYSSFFTVYFCRVLLSISTMLQHEVMLFERVGSITLSVSGNTIWANKLMARYQKHVSNKASSTLGVYVVGPVCQFHLPNLLEL